MALRRINTQHREAMRQLFCGRSTKEVAISLRKATSTVENWLKDGKFAAEYRRFEQEMTPRVLDVRARFEDLSPKAVDTLENVMDGAKDDAQRRLAANDILDRAGYPRTAKVESTGVVLQIPMGQLAQMMMALKESEGITVEASCGDSTG